MKLKPAKIINIVSPFGVSGALTARTFSQRFRTFSVHVPSATSGTVTVAGGSAITISPGTTLNFDGGTVTVPEGTTLNFDAGTQPGVTNTFTSSAFTVTCSDCIVIGTY